MLVYLKNGLPKTKIYRFCNDFSYKKNLKILNENQFRIWLPYSSIHFLNSPKSDIQNMIFENINLYFETKKSIGLFNWPGISTFSHLV